MTAPTTTLTLDIATYPSLTDTAATVTTLPWPRLAARLREHLECDDKDRAALWSPVTFALRRPRERKNENVATITAAVLDHDDGPPHWGLLDGFEYVAHTTHGHAPEADRWRVVLPLAEPCPAEQWPEAWPRIAYWLAPDNDPQTKDPSRAYWWPACRPGAERLVSAGHGMLLDWRALEPIPADRPPAPSPSTHGERRNGPADARPGDRYARETDWADILGPLGWTLTTTLHDGSQRWRCPNSSKRIGHCATTGGGGHDVLWVFCGAEGQPFPSRESVTKFRAYSLIHHGGDDRAAARELGTRYEPRADRGPVADARADGSADQAPSARAPAQPLGADGFALTDLGNAERLIARFGDGLRHVHPWAKWLRNDGRRWELDATAQAEHLAKRTVRGIYAAAEPVEDAPARVALVNHARRSEAAGRLAAMLQLAASEPGVPVRPEDLDRDPWLLNVLNGTLDLRTGLLLPHDPARLITKLAPAAYRPDATAPVWDAFLERIVPDPAVRDFLRRWAGYCLSGLTAERIMAILWGRGRNGKSTFLEVLGALLGDYAMHTPATAILGRRDAAIPNDLARLRGARFVWCSETGDGNRLNESLIKQLTGGDTISARFMRAEWFDFRPEFKVNMATNHRPVIKGTDPAIWDRVRLIPFTVRIPESEVDRHLKEKLLAQADGILAWAVRGCLEWRRDGLGTPPGVKDATDGYRAEMDVLGQFLADRCLRRPALKVTAKALYAAYREWCDQNGEPPLEQRGFGLRLGERGLTRARGTGNVHMWLGLALTAAHERPLDHDDTAESDPSDP